MPDYDAIREAIEVHGLTDEQVYAAIEASKVAKAGGEWNPILVDDLGQEVSGDTWSVVKKSGWYKLEDAHWGREYWTVTELGKTVLAPFVAVAMTMLN